MPGLGDQQVVLGADADAAPARVHPLVVGPDVQARLDREHHARLEQTALLLDPVTADIVHIQAQPMATLVRIETAVTAAGQDLGMGAHQQPQRQQTIDQHLHRGRMQRIPWRTRPGQGNGRGLRPFDQVIQLTLLGRETAIDREGAGDVGGIATVFGTGIDQDQLAIGGNRIVGHIVQHTGIAAGADNRAIRRPAVIGAEHPLDLRLQHILGHARTDHCHRRTMGLHTEPGGVAHQRNFRIAFEQPLLMQQAAQFDQLMRRSGPMAYLCPDLVDPAHQLAVKLRITAKRVVHPRPPFQQAGQDLVDVLDRIGIVGAIQRDHPGSAGTRAVPHLALGIALTAEHDHLAMPAPGQHHQHRLRLAKTQQVMEV